jgi:hypothetical protein
MERQHTLDVIRTGRKGRYLNALEKYQIYKISRNNLHMNYTYNTVCQTYFTTAAHTPSEKI